MAVQLVSRDQRIPSSRGLITAQNRRGAPFAVLDLRRWLRYNRLVFKADKVDVIANGSASAVIEDLLPTADELQLALSLRTDGEKPPRRLALMKERGLLDVFLCPRAPSLDGLHEWIDACRDLGIPLRLQLQAPLPPDLDVERTAHAIAEAGVVRANITLADPFLKRKGRRARADSASTLQAMQQLTAAIEKHGTEANILNVPLCLLDEDSLTRAANSPQCAADHAHYLEAAYALAQSLHRRGRVTAGKILLILLSRYTFVQQPMDNLLLPVLLHHNYPYLFARIFRRLTIHLRLARSVPKEISKTAYERELAESRAKTEKALGPACGVCALKRICDHETRDFKRVLPGARVHAIEGEHVVSALHFSARQPKHYDPLDQERLLAEERYEALAEEAGKLIIDRQPDLVVGPYDYGVEETHFDRMEGGLKWWSVSNAERLSTPLGRFSPPLTLSVDIGAGIADYIGFSFGRHCKIVCPMETYRHNLTLYIDSDGRYVLLRDKRPVRPAEFAGQHYLPLRLGDQLEPRLSAWNIDECIATHNLRIWTNGGRAGEDLSRIKYSIIIVSTRFTRRLHAVLRCLAHQRGIDLRNVEVIVCYVPGIDATDDLIDSVALTYPALRMVRSPFPENFTNSKGFLINESAKIASGEWIMLLDSDTLLPPDYFAKVEAASQEADFIAPDGRRLLPKDVSAEILMGELDPWEHWQELIEGAGEFRHRETGGVPVGFCQCFRAKYLQRFPYLEVEHFELADMQFGQQMRDFVGPEHRLSGTPVLHLDHGGSQWYGTQKHM